MNRLIVIIVFCYGCVNVNAQLSVFPGDANNDGVVNQYDVPAIGYAYGEIGPARIQDTLVGTQGISVFWEGDFFAEGLNYIYADANGDGIVNIFDFVTLGQYYGFEHENGEEFIFPSETSGSNINWNNSIAVSPLVEGQQIDIPLSFIIPEDVAVNGLAFKLSYNPAFFESVEFVTEDTWLVEDGEGIAIQRQFEGDIEIGMTRFGVNPINGNGNGGVIRIIIIDDMVDLFEGAPDTLRTGIHVEQVMMVDTNFDVVPVENESLELLFLKKDIISDGSIPVIKDDVSVFPNPVQERIQIHSTYDFTQLTFINSLGQKQVIYRGEGERFYQWDKMKGVVAGLYYLRIENERRVTIVPLVFE